MLLRLTERRPLLAGGWIILTAIRSNSQRAEDSLARDESVTVKGSPVRSLQKFLESELTSGQREAALQALPPEYATRLHGTVLPTRTLVSTIPSSPHPAIEAAVGLERLPNGKVAVDETLRVKGRADAWALGDCAAVPIHAARFNR